MLSKEALELIKNQVTEAFKSTVITIEIDKGFIYSAVMISSADKPVIFKLSTDLGWAFRDGDNVAMTGQEFDHDVTSGEKAESIAKILKADLEAKGFRVQMSTKMYR